MLKEETKYGGTKRRAYSTQYSTSPAQTKSMMLRRVNKIAKAMKVHNPYHMYTASLANIFPTISNTGSLYDVMQSVQQGVNFNDRFSSKTQIRRIRLRGIIIPGATATIVTPVRLTCIRAESGLSFATNMTGSFNPIQTGTTLQYYFDKFISVPAPLTGAGYPVNVDVSIKCKHIQKFSGTGAGTTSGESIYLICQSSVVAGTTAPVISGCFEVFFDPM